MIGHRLRRVHPGGSARNKKQILEKDGGTTMIVSVTRMACRVVIVSLLIVGTHPNGGAQSIRTCPDGQYLAKYYKNETAVGKPAFTRCEKRIDFDWGETGPSGTVGDTSSTGTADSESDGKADRFSTRRSVGKTHFSVRWDGQFQFGGGDYTFIATADDGIRVWVDGQVIIDEWRLQGATEFRATRNLTPGIHRVTVAYYQNAGGAVARLRWQR